MPDTRSLRITDLPFIPVLSDPRLSPDGRITAYVVTTADDDTDTYTSTIWWVRTDGSEPTRPVTSGPRDASPRWSPDGRTLAYVTEYAGTSQLRVLPVEETASRLVLELGDRIQDPQWSPDGARIAFTTVTRQADGGAGRSGPRVIDHLPIKADGLDVMDERRSHVFAVDAVTGALTQLTDGDFSVTSARWSPDGELLAYAATIPVDGVGIASCVFIMPAAGGAPRVITPGGSVVGAPTWFPDGQRLLVHGQERLRAGHDELFVVSAAGGVLEPLVRLDRNVLLGTSPGYPGALPHVMGGGDQVLFMVRDGGSTTLYSSDSLLEPRCLVGRGGRSLSGLSVAGDTMVFVAADAETSGEVWAAALDGRDQRRLTHHFSQALPDVALPRFLPREFEAPDGTPIQGWLMRAAEATEPSPLLLDIHGGPHNAWGPAHDGVHLYHHELVARGWTVLVLNPRGSDGYGEQFFTAVSGAWGEIDEHDFLAPVEALTSEGLVDPSKVVVTGYSYGGYMSCWLSARHPDRWAAAIPGGAATDLASLTGTSDLGDYLAEVEFGARPWQDAARLRASSPSEYVQHVTTPTLLLHGDQDHRCPVGQAEIWFTALHTQGVPVTLVRYPGASHDFIVNGRPSHRQDWCARIVDFAERHVARGR